MPIEGPLRELGMHDVFQLLDLSRKSGVLTVTSTTRDAAGAVYFDRGAVVHAALRSNPHPLGEQLRRAGKVTDGDLARAREVQRATRPAPPLGEVLVGIGAVGRRELERQVRFLVEEVIFDLLSWSDGYFSFEERDEAPAPAEANVRISVESLLMEGARRIDEWSRIEPRVPNLSVVPLLAPADDDGHAALLDLLPTEWAVLAAIDGVGDLRRIAADLARSEFEVAKIAYGLLCTGVIELAPVGEGGPSGAPAEGAAAHLERAQTALKLGELDRALREAREAVAVEPASPEPRLIAARTLRRMGRYAESALELRAALSLDALNPPVYAELGFSAAAQGDYAEAVEAWNRYLAMAPDGPDAARVRIALDAALRLRDALDEHAHV